MGAGQLALGHADLVLAAALHSGEVYIMLDIMSPGSISLLLLWLWTTKLCQRLIFRYSAPPGLKTHLLAVVAVVMKYEALTRK